MQDLTFVIGEDRAVAELWEALGNIGITMQASCTFPRLEGRIVHIVVTDEEADRAYEALRAENFIPLDRREVLIADFEVRPGELGRLARRITDAGAKVYIMYMATGDRVVIGASDLETVREVL
ncbi:MAG: hypothetical protein QNJ89_07320 [Acidimicrobiia bacterium]|nr:hypothetical protein [Acidimicrobiia bacterium]